MSFFPVYWSFAVPFILTSALTQPPEKAPPAQPAPTTPPAAAALPATNPQPAPENPAPTPGLPTPPKREPETASEKLLNQMVDKVEKIQYVNATFQQTIRLADQQLLVDGTLLFGPAFRIKLEMDLKQGESIGRRAIYCDGKTAFFYNRVLEGESISLFDLTQLVPLIKQSKFPAEIQEILLRDLPLLFPKQMLRGYTNTFHFTAHESVKVLGRSAIQYEGHWREPYVAQFGAGQEKPTLATLPPGIPQYVRLVLDEETGFPFSIELMRREAEVEYKPLFAIRASKVNIGEKIPDAQFVYVPPTNVRTTDETPVLVTQLKSASQAYADNLARQEAEAKAKAAAPVGDKAKTAPPTEAPNT